MQKHHFSEAACHLLPLRKNRAYFFLFDYASLQTRHGPTFCKITYIKNLLNITIKPKTQYYLNILISNSFSLYTHKG